MPREDFLGPGPWQVMVNSRYFETPSNDPVYLYQNGLIALDAAKGINNGEPFLHAAWLTAVAPQAGETVCHIGAGTGYYTAMLASLVMPGGRVEAFDAEPHLAEAAKANLETYGGVRVTGGDATVLPLPEADVVYVNAGVEAPPASWLKSLREGGRMIFPWRPAENTGLAVLVTRSGEKFAVQPLMASWFIPCAGAWLGAAPKKSPSSHEAWEARSLWLSEQREPDETAVAIYRDVWFSSAS